LPCGKPDCRDREEILPKIYHSVGRDSDQKHHQLATTASNPQYKYERRHHDDKSVLLLIRQKCGVKAAYSCLAPPAYRADIFRFCVMYAEGGLYLDQDIFPIVRTVLALLLRRNCWT
jgi:mannosyltransferase OCH1-like enzyme